MRLLSAIVSTLVVSAATGLPASSGASLLAQTSKHLLDVIYVPTPAAVVQRMLTIARVRPGDVVYDLGSGDGRIVIAAVRDFGAARGVGIELDPQRITEANANAAVAGVADRVRFVQQDLFEADFSDATVVTLYLLPAINLRLEPRIKALKSGTRIVSHNYDFGPGWKPAQTVVVDNNLIHFWTVPKH